MPPRVPLIALRTIREVRSDLDEVKAESILPAGELGASLEDIAEALGVTRQGRSHRLKHLNENGHDEEVNLTAGEPELARIP